MTHEEEIAAAEKRGYERGYTKGIGEGVKAVAAMMTLTTTLAEEFAAKVRAEMKTIVDMASMPDRFEDEPARDEALSEIAR